MKEAMIGLAPGLNHRTVLIVEDYIDLQQACKTIFAELGVSVVTASDGREAKDCIHQRGSEIDLILLDLDLPYISGEVLYRLVHAEAPHIRVIVTSACDETTARRRLDNDHAVTFLPKPFGMTTLVNEVITMLTKQSVG